MPPKTEDGSTRTTQLASWARVWFEEDSVFAMFLRWLVSRFRGFFVTCLTADGFLSGRAVGLQFVEFE